MPFLGKVLLGLINPNLDNNWEWLDGVVLPGGWPRWAPTQPLSSDSCSYVAATDYLVYSGSCFDFEYTFLCERPANITNSSNDEEDFHPISCPGGGVK